MTMTKQEAHKHKYTQAKYITLPIENPDYNGLGKRILKLLVCKCGHEIGNDLLDKIPERKAV